MGAAWALPEIDAERCDGCGDCVEACPQGALALEDGKAVMARPADCDYCADCEAVCPPDAIRCPFEIVLA